MSLPRGRHITASAALGELPGPHNTPYAELFTHGTLSIEIYAPRGVDTQQPHDRDEAYVVLAGTGEFVHGDARSHFGPGDFLFVPAGMVHRFEKFSADLAVWVLFYGPAGGEKPG